MNILQRLLGVSKPQNGIRTKWELSFSNGDNFRKWGWYDPCSCGCDSRGDTEYFKLKGYYSGGFGLFGFSLIKYEISLPVEAYQKWGKAK